MAGGIFCVLAGVVGASIAFNMDSSTINNPFKTTNLTVATTENFSSPTNWSPCEKIAKTVATRNDSDAEIKVRVSYKEYWESKTGSRLGLSRNGVRLAEIVFQNESDWEYRDGYYYYKNILAPGDETNSLFEGVMLSCNANLGHDNVCSATGEEVVCTKPNDPYEEARYHLDIKVETLQADAVEDEWLNAAYLDTGENVNDALVQLAGGDEDAILSIAVVSELPDTIDQNTTEKALISIDGSTPIYAYDNGDHNIIIHSAAKKIYANSDSSKLFRSFSSLTALSLPECFDTSLVTNMYSMFGYLTSLTSLSLSDSFDTSSVTDMSFMFYDEESLTSLSLPDSFNTSSVTNMKYMFSWSKKLVTLHLPEAFDTSSVTDMNGMFGELRALTSLELPSAFIPASVQDMGLMFYGMSALTSLSLPDSFDTSLATNMQAMFYDDSSLTTLVLPELFSTSSATDIGYMFRGMTSLSSITLPKAFKASPAMSTSSIFSGVPADATLNSDADASIKALWPGQLRN